MSVLSTVLVTLVAFLFFYIMYLETFATDSESTSRVFNIPQEELKKSSLNTFLSKNPVEIVAMLLIYIILVAIYGGLTSDKKIILKQGGLPILALISLLF